MTLFRSPLILEQVRSGVFVRMAVLDALVNGAPDPRPIAVNRRTRV